MELLKFECAFCVVGHTGEAFTGSYQDYLASPQWKALRQAALTRADYRCQVCNSDLLLHVHHRRYPFDLGLEDPMDLTVLCRRCHGVFHNVRTNG
jgi:5-methylcytosine-specific restriction endonuclease McrA